MSVLDSTHTFTLTVAGVDRWSLLRRGSLTLTDAEGGQVDTLKFELEDSADALSVTEWQEVVWTADGSNKLFGGYVARVKPRVAPAGLHRIWEVTAESYVTLLVRCPRVRQTWVNATIGSLVAALFTAAGLGSEFDTTTYVSAGATLDSWGANGEKLTEQLDALVRIASDKAGAPWSWGVDADKKVHFGAASSAAAAFSIASITAANWTTSFPPASAPDIEIDANDIRNRITVRGGTKASSEQTQTFSGNGATVLFALSNRPVRDIVRVTVGGVLQSHGTDWYDTFGGGYAVLVNYAAGTLRWPAASPPASGTDNIVVVYRYDQAVTASSQSAASQTQYGRWFDYEHEDAALTSEQQAQDLAEALLDTYAFGVTAGTLEVHRLGLGAGQWLSIVYPALGLNGSYVIRQATTTLDPAGDGVICTVKFGGRGERFGAVFGGGVSGGGAYTQPTTPRQDGEVTILRVRSRIELLDPLTSYVQP